MSQIVDGYTRGDASVIGPQIEAMLSKGEQVTLQISGDSMRPTLKPRRDAVVLAPIQKEPVRRGDILFFQSARSAGGYALHRVWRVTAEGVFMNGDAQNWVEGPISSDKLLAKAIVLMRNGKMLDVQSPLYRLYVSVWRITRPVRFQLFALWRKTKRLSR